MQSCEKSEEGMIAFNIINKLSGYILNFYLVNKTNVRSKSYHFQYELLQNKFIFLTLKILEILMFHSKDQIINRQINGLPHHI